jgi:hypothetical protein
MYIDEIAQQISAQLDPDQLPQEGDVDRLLRAYAVLARTKGAAVSQEDVHDAWAAWMVEVDPAHPALTPYQELDQETRSEDALFLRAIRTVATRLEVDG